MKCWQEPQNGLKTPSARLVSELVGVCLVSALRAPTERQHTVVKVHCHTQRALADHVGLSVRVPRWLYPMF